MALTIPVLDLRQRPFQLQVFQDQRPNKLLAIHRRAGKSLLAVNKLVHNALLPENKGKLFHYVAPTYRQAKSIIWSAPDMLDKYCPAEIVDHKNESEMKIYLKNGSQICIYGSDDPDRLRGMNPYGVIMDEAQDQKESVYNEIYRPILAANGGWIWMIGTPRGKGWWYRQKLQAERLADWQVLTLKASESGIISPEVLLKLRSEMPQSAYLQEMEVEFLEGAGSIFRRVRNNIGGNLHAPEEGRKYKMGVDLAKQVDWTVITVVDRHTHEVVHFDRFNQIDWNLQKARIEATARRYNNCPITIDATGVGASFSEDLSRMGLNVQHYVFTNQSKKNIIDNLVILIEQNKIRYPNIPELLDELESYSFTLNERTGNTYYNAPEGQHDDCFAKGTMILTDKGQCPIERIRVGDMVLTRQGYKPVVATRNKLKKVITNIGLTGTPDHPIIGVDGLIELAKAKDTDMLFVWNEKLSIIEEKTIIDVRSQSGDSTGFITGDMINGKNLLSLCIGRFGSIILELFHWAMLFTIKMITHLIILLKIWSANLSLNIRQIIYLQTNAGRCQLLMHARILSNSGLEEIGGESHQKVKKSFRKTGKDQISPSFLRERIDGSHLQKVKLRLKREYMDQFISKSLKMLFAWNAKKTSLLLQRLVAGFVKKRVTLGTFERVYNLQVADCPEYFANNILVHNCVISAALAYWEIGAKMPIDVLVGMGRESFDPYSAI